MGQRQRTEPTTSQLLTLIRNADTFEDATQYHRTAQEPLFQEVLYKWMQQSKLNAKDMIERTGIERSYFYHILSGKKNPGKNMVLRIGLCLKLTLNEMNHLLRVAGFSDLYSRRRRDAALIFAIVNHYTMEQTNDLLIKAEEDPLYWDDKHGK